MRDGDVTHIQGSGKIAMVNAYGNRMDFHFVSLNENEHIVHRAFSLT